MRLWLPLSLSIFSVLTACGPSTPPPTDDSAEVLSRQFEIEPEHKTGAELQESAMNSTVRTIYVCENAERLTVDFDNPRAMATVRKSDGLAHDLKQERSASGIWYRAGRIELRGSGRNADWTPEKGDTVSCRAID